MWKSWAMPSNKMTDEERRMVEEAVAAGKVTKVRPGAAKNDEMSRSTKELAAKERKEFNKTKKVKSE
jgi:hypothetical protein